MLFRGDEKLKTKLRGAFVSALSLLVTVVLTGCTLDDVSDGMLAVEDLLRDAYHAAKDIVNYVDEQGEEPDPKAADEDDETEPSKPSPDYEIENASRGFYGYESLSDEDKLIYDEIFSCVTNYAEQCVVSTLDSKQLRRVYDVMRADHGEVFWFSGYEYINHSIADEITQVDFRPNYTMSEMEKLNIEKQIDDISDEWLSDISYSSSDYAKSKYVFETLIDRVDYDVLSPNNQNIISAFIGGKTVCQGYAGAAQYLLRKLGVPSVIVTGKAGRDNHAWNLVRLDGSWYHMDVTWGNSEYTEGEESVKFTNYTYLNMTTADIEGTHTVDDTLELPTCDSMADNYFYREGLYYAYHQPDVTGGWLRKAYDERQPISIKLSDDTLYQKTYSYFIDDGHIQDYCPGLNGLKYLTDESARTITFRFDDNGDKNDLQ